MPERNDPILEYAPLFGTFEIEKLLGEGSYGRVYAASREDITGRYQSAVKHIRIPKSEEEVKEARLFCADEASLSHYFGDIVTRIINEVRVMYTLRGQRNIVAYEDHAIYHTQGQLQWDVLIRMELLEPLAQYLQRHPFTPADVCALGIDIASALTVCARHGVIHRDIKDSNIFVAQDGAYKLGDFGVARTLAEHSMSMRGTPMYLAPEIFHGKPYDATVDIYSLGILLYKLLNNGRYPFLPDAPALIGYADIEKAFVLRMQGKPIPPPAQGSEALRLIVLKACSHDSAQRFRSAIEMQEALLATSPEKSAIPESKPDIPQTGFPPDTPPGLPENSAPFKQVPAANAGEETICVAPAQPAQHTPFFTAQSPKELQAETRPQTELQQAKPAFAAEPPRPQVRAQKGGRAAIYALLGIAAIACLLALLFQSRQPQDGGEQAYADALSYVEAGAYADALEILHTLQEPVADSGQLLAYTQACILAGGGEYAAAADMFQSLAEFRDSPEQTLRCKYQQALAQYENKQYADAISAFTALGSYADAPAMAQACAYSVAKDTLALYRQTGALADAQNAIANLTALGDYRDAQPLLQEVSREISQQGADALRGIPALLQSHSKDFAARIAQDAATARTWYESIAGFGDNAQMLAVLDALQDVSDMQRCFDTLLAFYELPIVQEILQSNYFIGLYLQGKWEGEGSFFYLYTDPATIYESFVSGLAYYGPSQFGYYYKQYGIPVDNKKGKYGVIGNMSVYAAVHYYIADKTLFTGSKSAWWKPSLTFAFPARDRIVITDRVGKAYALQRVK